MGLPLIMIQPITAASKAQASLTLFKESYTPGDTIHGSLRVYFHGISHHTLRSIQMELRGRTKTTLLLTEQEHQNKGLLIPLGPRTEVIRHFLVRERCTLLSKTQSTETCVKGDVREFQLEMRLPEHKLCTELRCQGQTRCMYQSHHQMLPPSMDASFGEDVRYAVGYMFVISLRFKREEDPLEVKKFFKVDYAMGNEKSGKLLGTSDKSFKLDFYKDKGCPSKRMRMVHRLTYGLGLSQRQRQHWDTWRAVKLLGKANAALEPLLRAQVVNAGYVRASHVLEYELRVSCDARISNFYVDGKTPLSNGLGKFELRHVAIQIFSLTHVYSPSSERALRTQRCSLLSVKKDVQIPLDLANATKDPHEPGKHRVLIPKDGLPEVKIPDVPTSFQHCLIKHRFEVEYTLRFHNPYTGTTREITALCGFEVVE